jgi:DNA-binding transcriptional regulator YdaS (Cro superfamily)
MGRVTKDKLPEIALRVKVAKRLGITPAHLYRVLIGKYGLSLEHAVAMQRIVKGRVVIWGNTADKELMKAYIYERQKAWSRYAAKKL